MNKKKIAILVASITTAIIVGMLGLTLYNKNYKVVSKVGSEKIRIKEFNSKFTTTKESVRNMNPGYKESQIQATYETFRDMALTTMEDELLIKQKARELGVYPTDQDINKYIEEQQMEIEDKIPNESRGAFEFALTEERLFNFINKDFEPNEKEGKQYFEENKGLFSVYPYGDLLALEFKSKREANKMLKEIKGNQITFDEAYEEYNGLKYGRLYYMEENYAFHDNIIKGTIDLKENEISEVIEANGKYLILKKFNVSTKENIPTFDEAKEEAMEAYTQNRLINNFNDKIEEWRETEIKRNRDYILPSAE